MFLWIPIIADMSFLFAEDNIDALVPVANLLLTAFLIVVYEMFPDMFLQLGPSPLVLAAAIVVAESCKGTPVPCSVWQYTQVRL